MKDMSSVRAAQQAQELRDLGFTGPFDEDGDVMTGRVEIRPGVREYLTARVLELLRSLADGYKVSGRDGVQRPLFYLQTTSRKVRGVTPRVDWYATATDLADDLVSRGIVAEEPARLVGMDSNSRERWTWGPVPPAGELAVLPERETVIRWSHWWIQGPGHRVAERMPCAHGYNLTDTCPNCDADEEADATSTTETGRERPGEHWNARLIRWRTLRESGETGQTPERAAAQWPGDATPEQREALLDVVLDRDPAHVSFADAEEYRQARADLKAENDQRAKLLAGLRNQMELALQSTRDADVQNAIQFSMAISEKGTVRAMQLHAKEAARLDITERVWSRGVESGRESGDWLQALEHARTFALVQLRHNATARTRNRVDGALAQVMVDAASDLIDAMDAMLAKVAGQ